MHTYIHVVYSMRSYSGEESSLLKYPETYQKQNLCPVKKKKNTSTAQQPHTGRTRQSLLAMRGSQKHWEATAPGLGTGKILRDSLPRLVKAVVFFLTMFFLVCACPGSHIGNPNRVSVSSPKPAIYVFSFFEPFRYLPKILLKQS